MEFLKVLEQLYDQKEPVLGEDFTAALERSATEILTQKLTAEQGRELIKKYCTYIPQLEQNYIEQCTDQFLAFALNFCDKNLYYLFKNTYSTKFDNVRDDPLNHNELSLYLCKRVLAIDNKKWVLLFIQSRMEQTKTVEKKFILLEMLGIIAKQIENKEAFYPRILPDILRAVTDGTKKFEKYKAKYKSEELNQSAKVFQENFEGWVIDFLNRFIVILKNLPEVKNYKKLLSARDLIETDPHTGQIQYKNAPNQTLINHYIILFYLDILQGINEALHETGVFDEKNVQTFFDTSKKHFLDIIPGTQELVENFMYSLRYNNFSSTDIQGQVIEYTPYLTYNLTGMGFFIKELFAQKSFQVFYSTEYKLKILLPYIRIFLQKEPSKAELVKELIQQIPDIVNESNQEKETINNVNYFNVPASKVLVGMLEPVGQGYDKPSQQKFLAGLKRFLSLFDRSCLFEIFQDMVLDNENMFMSAFIFDMFRKELSESIKNGQVNSFTKYESVINLFTVLIEKQTSSINNLAEKASILCSALSTVEFVLMRMKNVVTNNTTSEGQDHLLSKSNILLFVEGMKKSIKKVDLRLGDSFDEVAQEKLQIEQATKVDSEEQKLNNTKNEQLSIVKFHAQQIHDEIAQILNLIPKEQKE